MCKHDCAIYALNMMCMCVIKQQLQSAPFLGIVVRTGEFFETVTMNGRTNVKSSPVALVSVSVCVYMHTRIASRMECVTQAPHFIFYVQQLQNIFLTQSGHYFETLHKFQSILRTGHSRAL